MSSHFFPSFHPDPRPSKVSFDVKIDTTGLSLRNDSFIDSFIFPPLSISEFS